MLLEICRESATKDFMGSPGGLGDGGIEDHGEVGESLTSRKGGGDRPVYLPGPWEACEEHQPLLIARWEVLKGPLN